MCERCSNYFCCSSARRWILLEIAVVEASVSESERSLGGVISDMDSIVFPEARRLSLDSKVLDMSLYADRILCDWFTVKLSFGNASEPMVIVMLPYWSTPSPLLGSSPLS